MIYPWQHEAWHHLMKAKMNGRLPHALLFTGIAGIGKGDFAEIFTRALLCESLAALSDCTDCHVCRLIEGRVHPNVLWVGQAEETIKVDDIRAVNEFIFQSSWSGHYRIVLIFNAETMNINASNALLKMLEEPAAGAILILISARYQQLPATILSRCQRLHFKTPTEALALPWLKNKLALSESQAKLLLNLSDQAPLKALALQQSELFTLRKKLLKALVALSDKTTDPLKVAAKLTDFEALPMLDYCLSWTMDLLRLQLGGTDEYLYHCDYAVELTRLSQKIPMQGLAQLLDKLCETRKSLALGINLNKNLLFETILINWTTLTC